MEISSLDTRAALVGWPVFRDGHVRRFLVIWLERQIERLGKELETVSEAELKSKQGQITAFRVTRTLLESSHIDGIISDITSKR